MIQLKEAIYRPIEKLFFPDPRDRLRYAWKNFGGKTGENVNMRQIRRIIEAEADVIEDFGKGYSASEEEEKREKAKADNLRTALKLQAPEDYDTLRDFFVGSRNDNFGKSAEEIERRRIQSKSAEALLSKLQAKTLNVKK